MIPKSKHDSYLATAHKLEQPPLEMHAAAAYLRRWLDGSLHSEATAQPPEAVQLFAQQPLCHSHNPDADEAGAAFMGSFAYQPPKLKPIVVLPARGQGRRGKGKGRARAAALADAPAQADVPAEVDAPAQAGKARGRGKAGGRGRRGRGQVHGRAAAGVVAAPAPPNEVDGLSSAEGAAATSSSDSESMS